MCYTYSMKACLFFSLAFAVIFTGCTKSKNLNKESAQENSAPLELPSYETGIGLSEILALKPSSVTDYSTEDSFSVKDAKPVVISAEKISPFNNGRFSGWGTSLCWWGNRIGYDDSLSEQAATLFFSKQDGIGLNIVRYNIGGGDNPQHKHITRTDSAMPGFLTLDQNGNQVYDWTSDHNQRNVLDRIIKAAGKDVLVEFFSNSPPYFMTVSGCSSGGTVGTDSNLRPEKYAAFADYLASVTEYMVKSGIPVTSLEPMNEPGSVYWAAFSTKQEGCHFALGEEQSRIIEETRLALNARGLSAIAVSASDETSTDDAYVSYNALLPKAKQTLERINVHTYNGTELERLQNLAAHENKNLWMSETDGSGTVGEDAGEMGAALWLSKKIIRDMNGLRPSAWILWQAIDSHISSAGYAGNKDGGAPDLNGGYWGLATANHDRKIILLTKKYYAMGQFSKYIRPESTVLYTERDNVLASFSQENGELVIVAVNEFAREVPYVFDVSPLTGTEDSFAYVVRTSGSRRKGENLNLLEKAVAVKGGLLYAPLAPNSITTFIVKVD